MHYTVFYSQMLNSLNINPNGIYVDLTLGYGGHSSGVLKSLDKGHLFAFDQDDAAIAYSQKRLSAISNNFTLIHDNFKNIDKYDLPYVDGVIMDLGVSSPQLDNAERGFSYNKDAPLDMRMDRRASLTAFDVVNTYEKSELVRILYSYGEEKWAVRIAEVISELRQHAPIETTSQLAAAIMAAVPKGARDKNVHPCRRSFMAIRIEVNQELEILEQSIRNAVELLNPKGRIGIITFHSLEDRLVKNLFKELTAPCTCPSELPMCVCNKKAIISLVNKKPYLPSEQELSENSRSKSAKLRVAMKNCN